IAPIEGFVTDAAGTSIFVAISLDSPPHAAPASGDEFMIGCNGTPGQDSNCTVAVAMNADESISGNFSLGLGVGVVGNGAGRVQSSPFGVDCSASCQTQFTAGSSVTLTETPAPGSVF